MKYRDVLKRLRNDDWTLKDIHGSHRQFVHPVKPGKVTVAGHPSDEVPRPTLNNIFKQAGWK